MSNLFELDEVEASDAALKFGYKRLRLVDYCCEITLAQPGGFPIFAQESGQGLEPWRLYCLVHRLIESASTALSEIRIGRGSVFLYKYSAAPVGRAAHSSRRTLQPAAP